MNKRKPDGYIRRWNKMWNQLPNLNDVSTFHTEPLIHIIIYQSNNKTLTVKFIRKKFCRGLQALFMQTQYNSQNLFSGTGFVVCYKIVIYRICEYEREHDRLSNESAQAIHG